MYVLSWRELSYNCVHWSKFDRTRVLIKYINWLQTNCTTIAHATHLRFSLQNSLTVCGGPYSFIDDRCGPRCSVRSNDRCTLIYLKIFSRVQVFEWRTAQSTDEREIDGDGFALHENIICITRRRNILKSKLTVFATPTSSIFRTRLPAHHYNNARDASIFIDTRSKTL